MTIYIPLTPLGPLPCPTHTCPRTRMHTRMCVHMCTHPGAHMHIHAQTHIQCTHAQTHMQCTRVHTHAHAHAHALMGSNQSPQLTASVEEILELQSRTLKNQRGCFYSLLHRKKPPSFSLKNSPARVCTASQVFVSVYPSAYLT